MPRIPRPGALHEPILIPRTNAQLVVTESTRRLPLLPRVLELESVCRPRRAEQRPSGIDPRHRRRRSAEHELHDRGAGFNPPPKIPPTANAPVITVKPIASPK